MEERVASSRAPTMPVAGSKPRNHHRAPTMHRHVPSSARYLHQGSLRPKLVVLKPERTFCSHPYGSTLTEKKLPPYIVGDIDDLDRNRHVVLSHSSRCSPRWCVATFVAVVFVALGLALGIYFGFKLVEVASKEDKMFRGSFSVVSGDKYERGLADTTTILFQKKAAYYQNKLETVFRNSALKNAFSRSEVLAIDPLSEFHNKEGLTVHFNLHVNPRKVQLDAGNLYLVLANEIQQPQSKIFTDLQIDPASLEIEERRREYSIFASGNLPTPPTVKIPRHTADPKTTTTLTTTTMSTIIERKSTRQPYIILTRTPNAATLSTASPQLSTPTVSNRKAIPSIEGPVVRQCQSISASFCNDVFYNATSYPNLLGHMTLHDVEEDMAMYRHISDSDCYKYGYHFLCALLQPPCFNHHILSPCKQYCETFVSQCRKWIPDYLLNRLKCETFPTGGDTFQHCLPEPDCSTFLNAKDKSQWICDGIVDCEDFSDELKCEWCQPGQFRCGDQTCVDRPKRCDNTPDCPNSADELNCLPQSPSTAVVSSAYQIEGYLILQDRGDAAKVCVDTLNHTMVVGRTDIVLHNIGLTACELLNYQKLKFVRMEPEVEPARFYFHIIDPLSARVTFMRAPCQSQHVVYIGCSNFACGRRLPLGPPQTNTVNSPSRVKAVHPGDWPWHVALFREGIHTCDGTLVSDQWVLTSESCFQGQPKSRWVARLGTPRLLTTSPDEQRRRVIGMIRSPVEGSTLVLIHLSLPVNFSELVRPICLANRDDLTPSGQNCITLGWDKLGHQLQERPITIVDSHPDCQLAAQPSPHNTCAIDKSSNETCQGEELPGGPILCQEGNTWYIGGVLNWRIGCSKTRRVYLFDRVSPNAPWILHTLEHIHSPSGR